MDGQRGRFINGWVDGYMAITYQNELSIIFKHTGFGARLSSLNPLLSLITLFLSKSLNFSGPQMSHTARRK
jgi:hypothetical protein